MVTLDCEDGYLVVGRVRPRPGGQTELADRPTLSWMRLLRAAKCQYQYRQDQYQGPSAKTPALCGLQRTHDHEDRPTRHIDGYELLRHRWLNKWVENLSSLLSCNRRYRPARENLL